MSTDTIFGKIIRGEIPVNRVYEDEVCLAFYDIAPAAPVHVLVIPKTAVASLGHTSQDHAEMLGHLLQKAGFRLVVNTGADGGQTVDHLHLHILGGRPMSWPPG